MLTNTVIKVTFGDLRAQQISAIIFQCGVLYHTEFDFLWLFIHLRPRKNGFKYLALLRENKHLSRYQLSLREISYVLYARALMTQKSCAVGMRNAKLGKSLGHVVIWRLWFWTSCLMITSIVEWLLQYKNVLLWKSELRAWLHGEFQPGKPG